MEPLRTFVVQAQQRAACTPFSGQPVAPWTTGKAQSLPPPPDRPKKQPRKSDSAISANPHMVRVATPEGRHRWVVSASAVAEVQRRVLACHSLSQIARAMGISTSKVCHIAQEMREAQKGENVLVASTKQTRTPVMVALPAPAGTAPSALAVAARFVFEVRALPMPITHTANVSTEPRSGTHVLDWSKRMSSYEYTEAPAGCLPRKPRKRVAGLSRGQMRDELRGHTRLLSMSINSHAINCAARANAPAPVRGPSPFDDRP